MVSFQEERFKDWHKDAQELFPQHYEELAMNQDVMKMELSIPKYEQAEIDGVLHIATARDEGQIVGYFISAIMPHLHYASVLCASTDMYYIKPEYRKRCGAALFKFVELCWKAKGVKKAYVSCKAHLDKQDFLEGLGYTFSDKMFIRLL
jgi:hypothetical protein